MHDQAIAELRSTHMAGLLNMTHAYAVQVGDEVPGLGKACTSGRFTDTTLPSSRKDNDSMRRTA